MVFSDRVDLKQSSPSLSIVICAYTMVRFDQLIRCCVAAHSQLRASDELVLVVDYNDELFAASVERFAEIGLGQARVVINAASKGLSGARNTGVNEARGDVIAFVDDDAEVMPDWSEKMLVHYSDPAVAGVGGFAVPDWPGDAPEWMPPEFYWVVGCSHVGLPEQVAEVRNFIGCNMSFRRRVFDRVGGFDTAMGRVGTLPVGCEETELCIRYHQAAPEDKLLFDPAVRVRHSVSEDRVLPKYFRRRCFGEGFSKRRVAQLVGATDGLSSERAYVSQVLPRAFFASLLAIFLWRPERRRRDSLGRCVAIVLGLVASVLGYGKATAAGILIRRSNDVSR